MSWTKKDLVLIILGTLGVLIVPFLKGPMIGAFDISVTLMILVYWFYTRGWGPLVLLILSGVTSIPDLIGDVIGGNPPGTISALTWIGVGVWATQRLFRDFVLERIR